MKVRRTVERYQVRYQQPRPNQSEAGQAIIEFALTISLTLLLIFGMIDFSRAVYTASVIQWAAQQGARAGIADPAADLNTVVGDAAKARLVGLDLENVGVNVGPLGANKTVSVTITYPFQFITPVGGTIQMRASASMVAY